MARSVEKMFDIYKELFFQNLNVVEGKYTKNVEILAQAAVQQ